MGNKVNDDGNGATCNGVDHDGGDDNNNGNDGDNDTMTIATA